MKFKSAELDTFAKIITIGIFVLFVGIIIFGHQNFYLNSVLFLVIFVSGMFSPISYSIDKEFISVYFLFFKKKIPRKDIVEIKTLESKEVKFSIRTFGIGGFFGYIGFFYNSKFGNMRWFATNRNYFILISTNNRKKIVISPKLKDKFVSFFNET